MPPTTSAATGVPSPRAAADAALAARITGIHDESEGHLRVAAGPPGAAPRGRRLREAAGRAADARRRAGGPPQEAVAHDHHRRPGRRAGPGPDPARLRAAPGHRPALRRRHHLHRDLGGLGLPGHRHRPGQPPGRRLGAGRSHAHRARRGRPGDGLRPAPPGRGRDLPLRPRLPVHQPGLRRPGQGQRRGPVRVGARASAGTTPSPRASSPPSSASSSTTGPGRPGPGCTGPSSTTSRAGTTPAGSTAPSATSAPPNTSQSTTTPPDRRHDRHRIWLRACHRRSSWRCMPSITRGARRTT